MKKSLHYYLNLPYRLSIVPDLEEGGFAAEYPELPGCITCGKTIVEVLELAEDAKNSWLTVAYNNDDDIPIPESIEASAGI